MGTFHKACLSLTLPFLMPRKIQCDPLAFGHSFPE